MNRRRFNTILAAALALCSTLTFAAPTKIACIGDSITAGVGAKNRKTQTYPAQLQDILGDKYEVKNCGTSGIMMSGYLSKWSDKIKAFQPDIVTIKLGTNDTKGRKFNDPNNKAKFDKDYKTATLGLLDFLNGLDSKPKIYLCYPVPVFQDKWGINEQSIIEDILPALAIISKEKNLPVIDLYKPMVGKGDLVPDGVHPNEVAYKILAETIAKAITSPAQAADEETAGLRTWTDTRGRKVTASLVKMTGSYAVLKDEAGKIIQISKYQLSKADKEYIEKLSSGPDKPDKEEPSKEAQKDSSGPPAGYKDYKFSLTGKIRRALGRQNWYIVLEPDTRIHGREYAKGILPIQTKMTDELGVDESWAEKKVYISGVGDLEDVNTKIRIRPIKSITSLKLAK